MTGEEAGVEGNERQLGVDLIAAHFAGELDDGRGASDGAAVARREVARADDAV